MPGGTFSHELPHNVLHFFTALPDYNQFQIIYYYQVVDCGSFLIFECNRSISWPRDVPSGGIQPVPKNAIIEIRQSGRSCLVSGASKLKCEKSGNRFCTRKTKAYLNSEETVTGNLLTEVGT